VPWRSRRDAGIESHAQERVKSLLPRRSFPDRGAERPDYRFDTMGPILMIAADDAPC
jgi:hypothetical protein